MMALQHNHMGTYLTAHATHNVDLEGQHLPQQKRHLGKCSKSDKILLNINAYTVGQKKIKTARRTLDETPSRNKKRP